MQCARVSRVNLSRLHAFIIRNHWQRKSLVVSQTNLPLYRKKGGGGGKSTQTTTTRMSMEDFNWDPWKEQMEAVVKECSQQFALLKVGKADTQLLENLTVMQNKQPVPLPEIAQVNVKDGSTLIVSPFEPTTTKDIIEAIRDSDLEMSPILSGAVILVSMPKPTKEFKAKLVKMANQHSEQAKQSIRTIRRNLLNDVKKMNLPQDDDRTMQNQAQKLHDDYVKKLENLYKQKEGDLNR